MGTDVLMEGHIYTQFLLILSFFGRERVTEEEGFKIKTRRANCRATFLSLQIEATAQDMVDQGIIPDLILMLRRFCLGSGVSFNDVADVKSKLRDGVGDVKKRMHDAKKRINDAVDVDIQSDALNIISSLCKDSLKR